ncbi:MAG: hypothetical protein KDJ44_16620 [Rhodoblastus sp.]|nr:hypothetical protein [Rhodoblastus sp.]
MTDGLSSARERNIYEQACFTLMVYFAVYGGCTWGKRDYDYNFLAEVFLETFLSDGEVFALAHQDDPVHAATARDIMERARLHMRRLACVEFVEALQGWAGVSFGSDEESLLSELDAAIEAFEAQYDPTNYCRPPIETLYALIERRLLRTGAQPTTAAQWGDVLLRPTLIGMALSEFMMARHATTHDARLEKYGLVPEMETRGALLIRAQPHLAQRCLVMSETIWPEWDGDHHTLGVAIAHKMATDELSAIANRFIAWGSDFDRRIDGLVYEALRGEFMATRIALDEATKPCAVIPLTPRAPNTENEKSHRKSAEIIAFCADSCASATLGETL